MNTATSTQLYRHYNSTGELLYIGISLSVLNRLGQHKDNSHWFNSITNISIESYNTREEALIAERDSIINERPYYNTIHNNTLKRLYKRLDRLGQNINNEKNPILVYSERFNKRVEKWMDEYDNIRNMINESDWFGYCIDRGLNRGHVGSCWIGHGPYIN